MRHLPDGTCITAMTRRVANAAASHHRLRALRARFAPMPRHPANATRSQHRLCALRARFASMALQPANATCPWYRLVALRALPAAMPSNPTRSAALRARVASMPRHSANAAHSRHVAVHAGRWLLQGFQAAHKRRTLSACCHACRAVAASGMPGCAQAGRLAVRWDSAWIRPCISAVPRHLAVTSVCVRPLPRLLCPATPPGGAACADVALTNSTGNNPACRTPSIPLFSCRC